MNFKSLFLVFSILVISMSCQQKKECCSKDKQIESATSTDESIYHMDSDWKAADGRTIKLNSFQGKIVVTAMVFTNCESACPRIVADIQRIEKEFKDNEQVHFLLITMDPERDTPEQFKKFAGDRSLGKNWTMISSTQPATDEIANILGVKIKKLSDGGFDHSNSIYVLNKEGVVVHTQEGLEQEPIEAIKKIKELINE